MFVLTKRVGNNFCILDDSDGSCEWLTSNQVNDCLKKNIQITGIQPDVRGGCELRPQPGVISGELCNWYRGTNLLEGVVTCPIIQKNAVVTFAFPSKGKVRGKTYKGTIEEVAPNGNIMIYFSSCNVMVIFNGSAFRKVIGMR